MWGAVEWLTLFIANNVQLFLRVWVVLLFGVVSWWLQPSVEQCSARTANSKWRLKDPGASHFGGGEIVKYNKALLECHVTHLKTSHVTRHTSHVTRHTSHPTPHTSHLTPHTSHLTPHTSHLTPHTSHPTPHTLTLALVFLQLSPPAVVFLPLASPSRRVFAPPLL